MQQQALWAPHVLAVLIAGFIFLLVSKPVHTIIFVLLFCGLVLVSLKETKRDEQYLRDLAAEREGESICQFARDFEMRQTDAWIVRAVYEQLQAHRQTQAIPVILLTAKVLTSDRDRFCTLGVAGVIAKPFNPVTVWQQMAQILDWAI